MKQNSDDRITIDSDRATTIGIAISLLGAILVAVSDIWRLVSGQVVPRVSLGTIIVAVSGVVALFIFRPLLLKLAFALMAVQAAARIILSHVHATVGGLHIVAMGAMTTNLVAVVIVIFVIVNWFRSVIRRVPRSLGKDATS
jgi:hypothetical protein